MSEEKSLPYVSILNLRDARPASDPYTRKLLSRLLNKLSDWLAHFQKEKSLPLVEMDCPVGNLRCARDTHYRISEEQAMRDRAIDVLSVNLMFPRR